MSLYNILKQIVFNAALMINLSNINFSPRKNIDAGNRSRTSWHLKQATVVICHPIVGIC